MIDRVEAAEALRAVEQVERRTGIAGAYSAASPHLLLSGAIWILGYVATAVTRPPQWPIVWIPLALLALLGSFLLTWRSKRPDHRDPAVRKTLALRGLGMALAILVFVESTFLLFKPAEPTPYFVFPALLMGLIYAAVGAFGLIRFLWIGAGIFALTICGLLLAPSAILYCVAAAGGGGLVLGGLWLRQA